MTNKVSIPEDLLEDAVKAGLVSKEPFAICQEEFINRLFTFSLIRESKVLKTALQESKR